jgi:glycogen(starch) synthase
MVSWEFPPLVVGGLGRHVGALAPALAELGHDVRVLTRGGTGQPSIEQSGPVTVHRAAADGLDIALGSESVLAWSQAFEHSLTRAGLRLIADWQPDVIHAHDWLVTQTAHTLHQASGAPVVLTMHATEHGRQQGWLGEPVPRAIHSVERWACTEAVAVIACSHFMASQLTDLFAVSATALTVIPNGVTPLPGDPSAARPDESDPLLAFAGRLVHEKGLQELIKALPLLAPDFPGIRLTVAGTGDQLADQQDRAARYGVADRIDWAGFLNPQQTNRLFASADVVVVPSLYEPFGMVALEAQLAGTPVAVSDTGGLRELVEPGVTGLRFAPESPAAIAAAVRELLENPARTRQMAITAQQRARNDFSWQAVARQTAAVYRQAVHQQRRPDPH